MITLKIPLLLVCTALSLEAANPPLPPTSPKMDQALRPVVNEHKVFDLDLKDPKTRAIIQASGGVITNDGPGDTPAVSFHVKPGTINTTKCIASFALEVSGLRGSQVALTAKVRGENIVGEDPTRSLAGYLGGKCQIALQSPTLGGKWLDAQGLHGTFDWREIGVLGDIMDDAGSASIRIGLEKASGTIWLSDVRLRVVRSKLIRPAPSPEVSAAVAAARTEFRGVMSPQQFREKDFDDLAGWNVNVIRWQMSQIRGDDRPWDVWFNAELEDLALALDAAAARGMKLVIDLHSPPGGRMPDRTYRMYLEKEYADRFVDTWMRIARRFKGHPGLWAYDLVNEPVQNTPSPAGLDDWLELQVRAARAVREIDATTPIMIATDQWNSPDSFASLSPVDVSGLIYQVHMYWPGPFTHQGVRTDQGIADAAAYEANKVVYPGMHDGVAVDKEALRRRLQPVRDFQLATGSRIFVGEFSAARWAPGAAHYLDDLISIYEEYGWDWAYHAFRESPIWSVEHANLPYDRHRHNLAPEPTDRQQTLLKWFAKNQKP